MKKIIVYASFALMAIINLNVLAAPTEDRYPEVKELSEPREQNRKYTWFWEREDEPKPQKKPAESAKHMPMAKNVNEPHIALLLPLTGQYALAAQAVREGFISAYYLNQRNNPHSQVNVQIYDTVGDTEITRVYSQAMENGANIVVGPMTKTGLKTLLNSKRVGNNTLVIALNTLEGISHLPRYLYPFALDPQDEAVRVAQQAAYDGRNRGVILAQDNAYGRRAAAGFKKRFELSGGTIADIVYYNEQRGLEDPVRYALQVHETKDAEGEKQVTRRQDIDFLFISASPMQARQIPPLMKFYYAQGVSLYAMGSVFSGVINPGLDNDLNGVVFCDSPWVISPGSRNSTLNSMAKQLLTEPSAQDRLFAFGADAFRVATNIQRLSGSQDATLAGATGTLSMDSNGFILRNPTCARFSQGAPRAL